MWWGAENTELKIHPLTHFQRRSLVLRMLRQLGNTSPELLPPDTQPHLLPPWHRRPLPACEWGVSCQWDRAVLSFRIRLLSSA